MKFQAKIEAVVHRHALLPDGTRIAVAVSGGSDSVFLLHALLDLGAEVTAVAHVNHGLRGEESEGDDAFVRELANRLGVPFHGTRLEPEEHGNLEQNLSRARRGFFARLVREGVADRVALGHTMDDQAETVLFRFLRGSGISGLAGILPVTAEGLIRPLLGLTREEIRMELRDRGIGWREDASNATARFARNRIRTGLLPSLAKDWNPGVREQLAQLADVSYEEERLWTRQVARAAPRVRTRLPDGSLEVSAGRLMELPLGLRRRMIRQCFREVLGHLRRIEFGHIEGALRLAASVDGEGSLDLPGLRAVRSFGWIRVAQAGVGSTVFPSVSVRAPGCFATPDGSRVFLEAAESNSRPINGPRGSTCDSLKMDLFSDRVDLRGWLPGDRYRPWPGQRTRNVAELFQEHRIPSWRRPGWPILIKKHPAGDQILWVRGFGVASEFAAREGPGIRIREENLTESFVVCAAS